MLREVSWREVCVLCESVDARLLLEHAHYVDGLSSERELRDAGKTFDDKRVDNDSRLPVEIPMADTHIVPINPPRDKKLENREPNKV